LRAGLALLAATLLAVGGLSGCGGSSKKKTSTATQSRSATTTSGGSTAKAKALATANAVVDAGDGQPGPDQMRITIYDLRSQGPFVVLDFSFACTQGGVGSTCDQSDFAPPLSSGTTAEGVSLVDPVAQKEYRAVTDSQGRPATSAVPSVSTSSPPSLAWVKFPAPPASVRAVDVVFPNGGPLVTGLPIGSGQAPTPAQVGVGVQPAAPAPFAQPPDSTSTTGLTLPVLDLITTAGNPSGANTESAKEAQITLHSDVLFHFNKSNLTPRANAILNSVAPNIKSRAVGPVSVTGYTDSIGTDAVNIPLSQARAASVATALKRLTPGVRYTTAGKGSADPVAPNTKPDGSDNPAGRALNRRVTISYPVKAPAPPTPPPAAVAPQTSGSTGLTTNYTFSETPTSSSTYQVTVNRFFRDGALGVLELTARCTGLTGPQRTGCDGEFDWGGSATVPPQTSRETGAASRDASGIYVTDPATGTDYIPVRDSKGSVMTAGTSPWMGKSYTYPLWLYFPVPPASTSTVNVLLPGAAASINSVPVSATPSNP
jgi:outer membrane protein OmpA-like peptidoglycan-associated protein